VRTRRHAADEQDAGDVAAAVAVMTDRYGWRVCPQCGNPGLPPEGRRAERPGDCIDCTCFTINQPHFEVRS
jgi:hypothetical protein